MIVFFDNTVIGDKTPMLKSIYKKVEKETGLSFHPKFRYCESSTEDERIAAPKLLKMGYELKYFSGCFNPYLCRRMA